LKLRLKYDLFKDKPNNSKERGKD